jgi:ADP-heptose:LPS heptosyltransferase
MTHEKKLGIWMDHATAHLTEFDNEKPEKKTITSKFSHEVKEEALHKGERMMHNKEQHQQAEYYKQLGEEIKHYQSVLLFGPTDAKSELYNTLKKDHQFEHIKIEVKQADKMTDNQQQAFVKSYFTKD